MSTYDPELIPLLKQAGGRWDPKVRNWMIPNDSVDGLKQSLRLAGYHFSQARQTQAN